MPTLPAGYTELQYIQSSGDCGINTGYLIDFQKTRIVIEFSPVGTATGFMMYSNPENGTRLELQVSDEYIEYFGYGGGLAFDNTHPANITADINYISGTITVNSQSGNIYTINRKKTMPLWIYSGDDSTLAERYTLKAKFYSCKIYEENVLKMDLVPCKNSSNVVGIYEKVSGGFYTNQFSGSLSAGASVESVITVSASPTTGGSVSGGGTYRTGNTVTVSAVPSAGYQFVSWNQGNQIVSISAQYSFTANGNRTLTAVFQETKIYTVTVQASPKDGGTVSGGGSYITGTSVTVTAQPSAWYEFVGWTEGAETASANASYTFQVTSNRALTANFEKITVKPSGPSSGLNRREMYIDARDLQSDSDPENPLTADEYLAVLQARGLEKLAENQLVKSFSAKVRLYNATYQYGVDFFDGDTITVTDERLGVSVDAIVQGAEITWDERGESLVLTLGYGVPTTSDILKRKVDK